MAKKQFYGLTFPFTAQDDEHYFLDVNHSLKDKVRSLLMHVIFTPKGQKLRDPEFGTDLIKFIFEPNDSESWENIKREIQEAVKKYVGDINIKNIDIMVDNEEMGAVFVKLQYSVSNGIKTEQDSFITRI